MSVGSGGASAEVTVWFVVPVQLTGPTVRSVTVQGSVGGWVGVR
jgi:hypothetical protein